MVDSFFNSPFRGLPRNGNHNTHTMTRQQQLIALHAHLCKCTTLTNTICSGSYEIFKSLGMPDLALFQMKDLFFELHCMGLITEYQHHESFLAGVIDIWTCKVIKREFPQSNTTNND